MEMSTHEQTGMFAVLPDDMSNGLLIGELQDVLSLYKTLKQFIENDIHDSPIDNLDEQLGWKWLTITEISEKYNIPVSTVRTWPKRIAGSIKQHGRWYMPEARVRGLVTKWDKRKTK